MGLSWSYFILSNGRDAEKKIRFEANNSELNDKECKSAAPSIYDGSSSRLNKRHAISFVRSIRVLLRN